MSDDDGKLRRARSDELRLNLFGGTIIALVMVQALLLLAMPFGPSSLIPTGLALLLAIPAALSWKAHVRSRADLPAQQRATGSDMGSAMVSASMSRSGSAALSASAANAAAASRGGEGTRPDATV